MIGKPDWQTRLANPIGKPDWQTRLANPIGKPDRRCVREEYELTRPITDKTLAHSPSAPLTSWARSGYKLKAVVFSTRGLHPLLHWNRLAKELASDSIPPNA
jgi:hypothetical protein